jgi:hypothetical protein
VVEMANDEVFKTRRQERVQQNHRVTTARDADEKLFALGNTCHRLSEGLHHGIDR